MMGSISFSISGLFIVIFGVAQQLECAEPKLYLHARILGGKLAHMICRWRRIHDCRR
jgi:hypothetical protein